MGKLIVEVEGRDGEAQMKALAAAAEKMGLKIKYVDDSVKKTDETLKRNAQTIAKSTADYQRHVTQQERLVAALKRGGDAYQRESLAVAQENKIAEVSAQLRGKNAQLTASQASELAKLVEREKAAAAAMQDFNSKEQAASRGSLASLSSIQGAVASLIGVTVGLGVIRTVFDRIVDETGQAEAAYAQLESAIKATGRTSIFTASQLVDAADRLANATGFDDEDLQQAEARLLRFEDVGSGVFNRTIALAADLARAMGTDPVSAAEQLGKALQEPDEALSLLERSLGRFSDAEEKAVVSIAKAGKEAEAQAMLLSLVERRVKGTAEAYAKTLPGAIDISKKALGDFFELAGNDELSRTIKEIGGSLNEFLKSDEGRKLAKDIGEDLAGALGLAAGLAELFAKNWDLVVTAFEAYLVLQAPGAIIALGRALMTLNFNPLVAAVVTLAAVAAAMNRYIDTIEREHQVMLDELSAQAEVASVQKGLRDRLSELDVLEQRRLSNHGKLTEAEQGRKKSLLEMSQAEATAISMMLANLNVQHELARQDVLRIEAKRQGPIIGGRKTVKTGVLGEELEDAQGRFRQLDQEITNINESLSNLATHGLKVVGEGLKNTIGLSDEQTKALESAREAMAAIALAAEQREREAKAAKLGADALRLAVTATEAENAVMGIRVALQKVGLDLSEKEIASITKNIERQEAAAAAIDREKMSMQALVDLAKSSVASGLSLQLKTGEVRDLKEYSAGVAELGFNLARLEVTLGLLGDAQDAAGLTAEQLREMAKARNDLVTANELYTRSMESLALVTAAAAVKIDAGRSAFEDELEAIQRRTAAVRDGSSAVGALAAEEDLHKKALEIVNRLIAGDGVKALEERTKALLNMKNALRDLAAEELAAGFKEEVRLTLNKPDLARISAEIRQINDLLADGFITAAEAAVLYQNRILEMHPRFAQLADGMANVFADAFSEIIKQGKIDFQSLGQSIKGVFADTLADILHEWLAKWFRAMAEWLVRWIATQRAAAVVSAASGTGGGAAGSNVAGLAMNAGQAWLGAKAAGAASGSSGGAGIAGAAWMIPVAIGLIAIYKGFIEKSERWGEASTGGMTRGNSAGIMASVRKRADEVVAAVQEISKTLDLTIAKLGDVIIAKHGNLYSVKDNVATAIGTAFDSAEAAMEYAKVRAIQLSEFGDSVSEMVKAAVKGSRAKTVEALSSDVEFARMLENVGKSDFAANIGKAWSEFEANWKHALDLFRNDLPSLTEALTQVGMNYIGSIQRQIDELTGKRRSPQEELALKRQEAELLKRRIELDKANIAVMIVKVKADIAALESLKLLVGAGGGSSPGTTGREGGGLLGLASAMMFVAETANVGSGILSSAGQAQLDALKAQLSALEGLAAALANLHIDPMDVRVPRGGGGRSNAADVKDFIADRRMSMLPDLQRQIAELNKEYEEQIKKAGKNADLIKQLNGLRQREIDLLAEQTRRDLITPFLGGPMSGKRSPFSVEEANIHKQYEDLRKVAKDLKIPLWQVNQAERERIRLLQLEAAAAAGSRLAQTQLEMERLGQTIDYLRQRAEENADALKAIGDEQFLSLGDSLMGFIDKYYKGAAGFEDFRLKLEQVRFEMEFANMQLQFEMLKQMKILTAEQVGFIQGAIDWIKGNKPDLNAVINQGPQVQLSSAVDSTVSELERLRDAFKKAKDGIREAINQLDAGQFGGVPPDQAIAAARSQFDSVINAARVGNLEALQTAPQAQKDFIEALKRYSPALFAAELPKIRNAMASLLNVDTVREGNLTITDRFQQQRHEQTVQTLNHGFGDLSSHASTQEAKHDETNAKLSALIAAQEQLNQRLINIEVRSRGRKQVAG